MFSFASLSNFQNHCFALFYFDWLIQIFNNSRISSDLKKAETTCSTPIFNLLYLSKLTNKKGGSAHFPLFWP